VCVCRTVVSSEEEGGGGGGGDGVGQGGELSLPPSSPQRGDGGGFRKTGKMGGGGGGGGGGRAAGASFDLSGADEDAGIGDRMSDMRALANAGGAFAGRTSAGRARVVSLYIYIDLYIDTGPLW
jgi:hypothetical protein